MTFSELENDPAFRRVSYAEQTALRGALFEKTIATDPRYATLRDDEKAALYAKATTKAPVFEDTTTVQSDYYNRAMSTVARLQAGDRKAIGDAVAGVALRNTLKSSFVATVVGKGVEAVASALDPTKPRDALSSDYFGKDGQKITDYLTANLRRYGGEGALKQAQGWSTVGELGLGLAEMLLVGGPLIGGVAKGGLLTAKLFGEGGKLATGISKIASSTAKSVAGAMAPELVESSLYGVFGTVEDAARRMLQGELQTGKNSEWWGTIARDLGVNVALDYVGWGILKGASTVARSMIKTQRGVKVDVANVTQEAIDREIAYAVEVDGAYLKTLPKSQRQEALQSIANYRAKGLDMNDRAGAVVLGQWKGWDVKFEEGNRVTLTSIADPTKKFERLPQRVAEKRLAEIIVTGEPASQAVESAVVGMAQSASNANVVSRKLVGTLADDAKPEELVGLLAPKGGMNDATGATVFARAYLKREGASAEDVAKLNVRLYDGPKAPAKRDAFDIVLPRSSVGLGAEADYNRLLVTQLEEARNVLGVSGGGDARALLASMPALKAKQSAASFEATAHVAKTQLKAQVRDLGAGRIELTLQNGARATYNNLEEATAGVWSALIDSGKVDLAHLSANIQARSGYTLQTQMRRAVMPGGRAEKQIAKGATNEQFAYYQLVAPAKSKDGSIVSKEIDGDESLSALLSRHAEIDVRLPSSLSPRLYVLDASKAKIAVEESVASGQYAQLREFAAAFDDTSRAGEIAKTADGLRLKVEGKKYVVENDILGTRVEHSSKATALKAMRSSQSEWDKAFEASAMKGYKQTVAPDGSIVLVGPQGVEARLSSLAELRAWHEKTPMPSYFKEILEVDEGVSQIADAEIAKVAEALAPTTKGRLARAVRSAYTMYAHFGSGPELGLMEAARLHGDYTLVRNVRTLRSSVRAVDAAQARMSAIWRGVYAGADERMLAKIAAATSWADDVRASRWQRTFGEVMPDNAKAIIEKQKLVYESLFRESGIDAYKHVANYMPRIRDFLERNRDFVVDGNGADELLRLSFNGQVPADFKFFAENLRNSDLVRMSMLDNALEVAETYTHALYRKKYLTNAVKGKLEAAKAMRDAGKAKYSDMELENFADALKQLQAAPRSPGDSMFARASVHVGTTFGKIVKRVAPWAYDPYADPGDIIDKLHTRITLATQATKTFAPLRNFFQINLLSTVVGNSRAWRISKKLLDDETYYDALVRKMVKTGVAADRLPSEEIVTKLGFWRRQMRWNENMDVFTRAVAYDTGQEMFDEAAKRLRAGTIDLGGFAKETKLHMFGKAEQEQILAAVARGQDDVGRDVLGNALQTLTMFDYTKMAKPLVSRGVLGKLFGKFMTYPASTIGLYARILGSGSAGDRLAMVGRLALTTNATYYAFLAAGIDYQGFQWTDPFGFQGGPLWSVLVDGTQLLGKDASARMARRNLVETLPRLLSPTYAFARQTVKAMAYLDDDNVTGALVALTGAPVSKLDAFRLTP